MRQIRSALPRLSDRLGLRHAGHPVIAASCAVLYVAVLAEYVFSMAARVPGTATVRDIMLALAVLAGLVGGMFRPDRFLWPALVTGVILMLDVPMVTPGPNGHAGTDGMPADEHEYQQQLDELRDAASRAMGHTHEVIDSLEEHTPAQASRTPNKPTGSWRPSFPLPACYRQWNGDVRVPVVGIIGDVERPGHGFDNGSVSLEAAAESEPYRFVL